MTIILIIAWLAFGIVGTAIGNGTLRAMFPNQDSTRAEMAWGAFAALFGPINLVAVLFIFGAANNRKYGFSLSYRRQT